MFASTIRTAILKAVQTAQEWEHVGLAVWGETQTRYFFIDPILNALGWETTNPKVCQPEYRYKKNNRRVDYALFPRSTPSDFKQGEAVPAIIIECKSFRSELWQEHGEQLQAYLDADLRMSEGLAVLTNGDKWGMYLLEEGAPLSAIRPRVVDFTHDDVDYIAFHLTELMGRDKW